MGQCWLLASFRVLAKSQKMRTQICETVKSWLLKTVVESGGEWRSNVGESGVFGSGLGNARGGTEAQTASARPVGADITKNTRFLYEIYINTFPRLAK